MRTKTTLSIFLSIMLLNGIFGQIPTDGLVAYYPFNGNANDESGNNHNGVVNGAILTLDRFGNPAKAYYFNGEGNSISVSDYDLLTNSITICLWVKVAKPGGIQNFISKHHGTEDVELLIRSIGDRYAIEWTIGNTFFNLTDNNGYFIIDPDHQRFDFLTLVYDGNEVKFYINNQVVASYSISGRIANNDLPMVFGKYATEGNTEYFNGTLDDIRIYSRALKNQEIKALYSEGVTNQPSGLVAHYPFNTNANDESGFGNNGTVEGATLCADRFGNSNSAYSFDGIDDVITISNNDLIDFSNAEDFSVAFWMKTGSTKGASSAINKQYAGYWNGYYFCLNNVDPGYCTESGHIMFYAAAGAFEDACSDDKINDDEWIFVTGIHNSSANSVSLYINGVQQTDIGRVSGEIQNNHDLLIGCGPTTESGLVYFKGIIDDIRIYNRTLNEQEISDLYCDNNLSIPSITVGLVSTAMVGDIVEVPVLTSELYSSDNIISYQFNLTFNNSVLEYIACDITGTIASGGTVIVNSEIAGHLMIGYLNSAAISGSGSIAILKFRVIREGYSHIAISEFLYNADAVTNITNGFVSTILLGDVDANSYVQAYDAALTLQYSVGLDPLHSIDPLPWETWRIVSANVDSDGGITAYDASLILQKAVGLIDNFPAENFTKGEQTDEADVLIVPEDQYLSFYAIGSIYSLNIFVDNPEQLLGNPELSLPDAISAFNETIGHYAFGAASVNAFSSDKAFLNIPCNRQGIIALNLVINANYKTIVLDLRKDPGNEGSSIFPNPATDHLQIYNPLIPAKVDIFGLGGDIKRSYITNSMLSIINIADLSEGMYILRLQTNEGIKTYRIIKQ